MKIMITDCDHPQIAIEQDLAARAGFECELGTARTAADVIAAAQGAQALLVQYAPISAAVLTALPDVRVISRYGVGVDTVDVVAATDRGVVVCNVPDYGTEAVSDHAIALALGVGRGLGVLDRGLRAGSTDLRPSFPVFLTGGRIFGVLGYGLIGRATARKAAGLGFRVIIWDLLLEPGRFVDGFEAVSFTDLLERSQVLSVHVPLTDQTRAVLGAEAFGRMRSDAIVINTARGAIIDTEALTRAVLDGTILGAGLDVTEPEPLPFDHPLLAHPRVLLTPHSAFYSEESFAELKRRTAQNAIDVLTGTRPRNVVNPEVL